MTEQTNQDIRTATVSIPLNSEQNVRPSKPAVSKVTWNAYDSSARADAKHEAREQAIAEHHQRLKEQDEDYRELQRLRQVVQDQQNQIDLLMKLVKQDA